MEPIFDYMRNDEQRHMLNELTQKTFRFDFEDWVVNGYFEGDYIPYSFAEDGRVISNVSVNRMQFIQNGVRRYYIQLGTVMTDEAHRKQGLAARLIKTVLEKYSDECDGIYLFANLSALDFYRKTGFSEIKQYRYTLKKDRPIPSCEMRFRQADSSMKQKYMDAVRHSAVNSSLEQTNKFGLQMFYTADLSGVYYAEDIDCFIVMNAQNGTAELQSVICGRSIPLTEVLSRIPAEYDTLRLGFSPAARDADLFDAQPFDGADDYRLFCCGKHIAEIEKERLYFPAFSHA